MLFLSTRAFPDGNKYTHMSRTIKAYGGRFLTTLSLRYVSSSFFFDLRKYTCISSFQVPEETVLTDPTGLHLNAGPYMLVYSRHLPEDVIKTPQTWPPLFVVCLIPRDALISEVYAHDPSYRNLFNRQTNISYLCCHQT